MFRRGAGRGKAHGPLAQTAPSRHSTCFVCTAVTVAAPIHHPMLHRIHMRPLMLQRSVHASLALEACSCPPSPPPWKHPCINPTFCPRRAHVSHSIRDKTWRNACLSLNLIGLIDTGKRAIHIAGQAHLRVRRDDV